ncbi:MAG: zinc-dependent peptidase [Comamonadaceae bacterium]|nr:MAG: zinc-dependent peptidase [Comamonadaceae bacterium]
MFGWLRRRLAPREIPQPLWMEVLARYPFIEALSQEELAKLRVVAGEFLAAKQFHGARGFAITDEVALAVTVQAVLPVLHLGLHWYDDFVGIVVHREEVVARRAVQDEAGVVHHYREELAGEAMDGGPVMVNWHDVDRAGSTAGRGYNVVIHEFVHKIDMRDGAPDGCPPLPSRAARQAWLAVLQPEYDAFREKVIMAERFGGEAPWLDAYGAEAIDEFFAVACEGYFVNPPRFAQEFPALVPLFDRFFKPKPG